MSWLDELKVAILNKNNQKILDLIEDLPNFDNTTDLVCARALVGEFIASLEADKERTANAMRQIKQMRVFLED